MSITKAYRYSENAVDTIQQKVVLRILLYDMRKLNIVIILIVSLRALTTLVSSLPGINLLATVIIAVYALRNPGQFAQMAAISAIDLVAMKILALLPCPVSVMQNFILILPFLFMANQMAEENNFVIRENVLE